MPTMDLNELVREVLTLIHLRCLAYYQYLSFTSFFSCFDSLDRSVVQRASCALCTIFKELKARSPIPRTPYPISKVHYAVPRCYCELIDIRSYLKRMVLEDLVRTRDIKKVHIKRVLSPAEIEQRRATMSKAQLKKTSVATLSQPLSTWMWQLMDKKSSKGSSLKGGAEDKSEGAFGAEVGVGEDWGHLNRRRRRAREEKVERDVRWMRKLQRARAEAEDS